MKPGVPGSRTEKFRASALKTEGNKDEAERMVDILRSWDTDGDGMFSVQEVLSAARQMAQEKKTSHRLRWVIIGIAIVYIATLLVLLGVTVLAVEISKDQRPDGNSNLISRHTKDVVRKPTHKPALRGDGGCALPDWCDVVLCVCRLIRHEEQG